MALNQGTVYGMESAADPLLSQFICTVAPINSDLGKVNHTSEMKSVSSHDKRYRYMNNMCVICQNWFCPVPVYQVEGMALKDGREIGRAHV